MGNRSFVIVNLYRVITALGLTVVVMVGVVLGVYSKSRRKKFPIARMNESFFSRQGIVIEHKEHVMSEAQQEAPPPHYSYAL